MRLRAALLSILLVATIAGAFILIDDTHDQTVGGTKTHVLPVIGSEICADLPVPPTNGELQYCSDCVMPSHPCVTGGTGAMAAYINGQWECFPGGNAVVLTPTPAATATPQPTATLVPTATPQPTATPGAGGGNVVDGSIFFPAADCIAATTTSLMDLPTAAMTPGPATPACVTGSNTQKGVLAFADHQNLSSQATYYLPLNNGGGHGGFDNTGTSSANIVWYSPGTSGNVVWTVGHACVAAGATDDPSFSTDTVTSAAAGTTLQLVNATVTLDLSGCSPGDTLHLRPQRNANTGSDTLNDTANLIGFMLNLPRQ